MARTAEMATMAAMKIFLLRMNEILSHFGDYLGIDFDGPRPCLTGLQFDESDLVMERILTTDPRLGTEVTSLRISPEIELYVRLCWQTRCGVFKANAQAFGIGEREHRIGHVAADRVRT